VKVKEIVEEKKDEIVEKLVEKAAEHTDEYEIKRCLDMAARIKYGLYSVSVEEKDIDLKGFSAVEIKVDGVYRNGDEVEVWLKFPNERIETVKIFTATPAKLSRDEFLRYWEDEEEVNMMYERIKQRKTMEKRVRELEEELKKKEERIKELEKMIKEMEELEVKDKQYCDERIKRLEETIEKIKSVLEEYIGDMAEEDP